MSRVRDLASILTASSDMATDVEVTTAVSTHAAASDPHTGYLKESEFNSAGKNFIINGGMDVWQRGTSLTFAQSWANFPTDRFKFNPRNGAGTGTRYELSVSSETSIVPCQYALKIAMTSSATSKPKLATYLGESQFYYGKTLTLSFYMKASKSISVDVAADLIWANADNYSTPSTISVTTSWQRFSYTFSLSPSGTYNYSTDLWGLIPQWEFPSSDTYDVYISGVQLELGSTATLFSRSGGTMAGEVASCQRYFLKYGGNQAYETFPGVLISYSTTQGEGPIALKTTMRATPTVTFSTLKISDVATYNIAVSNLTITTGNSGPDAAYLVFTVAGGITSGKTNLLRTDASTAGYLTFSAEL